MRHLILLALASSAVVNGAAVAAAPGNLTVSPDGRTVIVAHALNGYFTPRHRATGTAVFDNFAILDPKGVYTVGSGAGFGNVTPNAHPVEIAAAFTAPANTTVTEIDVGAGYISGEQTVVKVHLYQDAGGVPGAQIWSDVTTLPVDGTCCAIAAATLHGSNVQLLAGKQYWVSLGIAERSPDTFAAWYGNVADQVDAGVAAINEGSGWTASPALPLPAFGVFGR